MSARFSCIKCGKSNISTFPICKFCNSPQNIAIKIPKNATKEQIEEYMRKLKEERKNGSS